MRFSRQHIEVMKAMGVKQEAAISVAGAEGDTIDGHHRQRLHNQHRNRQWNWVSIC
jgi:hypothetical protein